MLTQAFLKIIDNELSRRKSVNPQYSLRAFARDLEISASILSRVRNGTLPMSDTLKQKIKSKLFKSDKEFYSFLTECLKFPEQILKTDNNNNFDYSIFRYWYFWTVWQTQKGTPIAIISSHMAKLLSISETDATSIIRFFSQLSNNYNAHSPNCFNFAQLFKHIQHQTFNDRYIQLINNLPKSSLNNEFSSYISQKAFPLAINQKLAVQIQEKLISFSSEIIQMVEEDQSPKDQVCELVISLLPSPQLPIASSSLTSNESHL